MSGPKVVRVVTREERIATCTALMAQLDAAVGALKADAARFGDVEGARLAASTRRKEMLAELVHQDNFDQAELQIRQEVAFISAKRDEVTERAATAAAIAREQASRRRHAALTFLKELERRAAGQHQELVATLKQLASRGQHSIAADEILAKAMALLTVDAPTAQLSDEQRTLARSLQSPLEREASPAPTWTATSEQDRRIGRLQLQLSQIEVLSGASPLEAFEGRLAQLELEPDGPVRSMKLDALVLDVASTVDTLKRGAEMLGKAAGLLAEIDAQGAVLELAVSREELADIVRRRDTSNIQQAMNTAAEALTEARQRAAADARRNAVLSGLAELGYQVNETMSTSWVQEGRIVLKKAMGDEHGLEIASAPDAQRLQLRTVAFSATNSPASNLAAETTWCGDFSKLKERLKQQSSDLSIEKAMPVGAVPLKVVQAPVAAQLASAPAGRSSRSV